MNLLLKIILPVLVLIGSAFAAKKMVESKPETGRRGAPPSIPSVEATTLAPTEYAVTLDSQGTVEPMNARTLVPEVAGSVLSLSDSFVAGGRFKAGDVLVELDKRDFEIALTQARANAAQTRAVLSQELAQAEVAKREWESLRQGQTPSDLTLRKPQVAAARANLRSAGAQVQRAELDLERSRIIAPYDGMVLAADINLGQFVNRGMTIGSIYSVDAVDVRLPLSQSQASWLNLSGQSASKTPVTLSSAVGADIHEWQGVIERIEGVDANTQQLNIIARVANPETSGDSPLRVGQFVNAKITGQTLSDVFVIPRQSLRGVDEVVLLTDASTLKRQQVSVAWGDSEVIAVTEGLAAGSVLVTTPLSTVANDTPVDAIVDGVAPPKRERGQGQGRGGAGKQGEGRPQQDGAGQGQRRQRNAVQSVKANQTPMMAVAATTPKLPRETTYARFSQLVRS